MAVHMLQLMEELETKLIHDKEAEDNFAEIADRVVLHWQGLAEDDLTAGYATGEYKHSIVRESIRATRAEGGNAGGWKSRVVTYSSIAHFLEYGTGPDDAPNYPHPPKNQGHWTDPDGALHFWWNTPTPVFAFAARTEMDFNSSTSPLNMPVSKGAQRRMKHGTDIVRTLSSDPKNLRGGQTRDRSRRA